MSNIDVLISGLEKIKQYYSESVDIYDIKSDYNGIIISLDNHDKWCAKNGEITLFMDNNKASYKQMIYLEKLAEKLNVKINDVTKLSRKDANALINRLRSELGEI